LLNVRSSGKPCDVLVYGVPAHDSYTVDCKHVAVSREIKIFKSLNASPGSIAPKRRNYLKVDRVAKYFSLTRKLLGFHYEASSCWNCSALLPGA